MDMLFRRTTLPDLTGLLSRHRDRSPAPHLRDPAVRARVQSVAKAQGLWAALDDLDPSRPISVVPHRLSRLYEETGERIPADAAARAAARERARAALALWLGHPRASLAYLEDLIWVLLDQETWVGVAHRRVAVDLNAASEAAELAELLYLFGDRIAPEVRDRARREIARRIYEPVADYRQPMFWETARHNWNHVVNGELIRTALYDELDPAVKAKIIHPAVQRMTYALDGFGEDGSSPEGPGYWDYGFGHFVRAAYALFEQTAGTVNLMAAEKIFRIARFPLATDIAAPVRATFSDATDGYLGAENVLTINRFYRLPELFALSAHESDGTLKLRTIRELALWQGERAPSEPDRADYVLPDLGFVKMRSDPGPEALTVVALAGHNGVNHNHNDVGSFIVAKGGTVFLVDPGKPIYRRDTFSARRYESAYCNSFGHSLPIIDGHGQEPGAQYRGTLTVDLAGGSVKSAVLDLTHAYPQGIVSRLIRRLDLSPALNRLVLCDRFEFAAAPAALEEAFVTFATVTLDPGERSARLELEERVFRIAAESPGTFHMESRPEWVRDDPQGRQLVRLVFSPEILADKMTLRFRLA